MRILQTFALSLLRPKRGIIVITRRWRGDFQRDISARVRHFGEVEGPYLVARPREFCLQRRASRRDG